MTKTQISLDVLFITVVSAILFGLFMGSYHLITPDEGRYVEIAREMVVSGNYITPHLDGVVFLDKPILYYWIEAGLIKLFGVHEWSVRLLPLLFGVLGSVLVYLAGRELFSRRAGIVSALVLMTSLLYFMSSHYADMDLMVAVLIEGALLFFIMAVQLPLGGKRGCYLWIAYVFAAAAFLTKGLMGIVFPAMIIGVWILCLQRWKVILQMRLISGAIIFIALVAPWFIAIQKENPEFLNYFFVVQQFSRYLTHDFNMHKPFYFYVPIIVFGVMPWTLFIFQAFVSSIKSVVKDRQHFSADVFLLLWFFLILIFFSIPKSKIVGYILPVFPPVALLIGHYLSQQWEDLAKSRQLKICAVIFLVFAIIISFALIVVAHATSLTTPASRIYLSIISVVIVAGAALSVFYAFYRQRFTSSFVAIFITIVMCYVVTTAAVSTFKLANVKPLALLIKHQMKTGDQVITYNKYYQDLPVYLEHKVFVVSDWHNPDIVHHDNWRRELAEGILYRQDHYQAPELINEKQMLKRWQGEGRVFVMVAKKRFNSFEQVVGKPYYKLGEYDRVLVISNQK